MSCESESDRDCKPDILDLEEYTTTEDSLADSNVWKLSRSNKILFNSGIYFYIIERIEETEHQRSSAGVIAACHNCTTTIKGSLRISSNFLSHMKIKHPEKLKQFLEQKRQKTKSSQKCENNDDQHLCIRKLHDDKYVFKRKLNYDQQILNRKPNDKHVFNRKLLTFIASTLSPLSIVENKAFLDLFEGTGITIESRQNISNFLASESKKNIRILNEKISATNYICTTADIWSARSRYFFGYTCHWLNKDFRRESAVLACKRSCSAYTDEKVAEIITEINNEFGLNEKNIVCTLTDNGANFLNDFKDFGINGESTFLDSDEVFDDDITEQENNYNTNDEVDQIQFHQIGFKFLPHFKSASQTLNLILLDFVKLVQNNNYLYKRHIQAMLRCSSLWNKCHCPNSAKVIKEFLSSGLLTPVVTRLDSIYNSIKSILSHKAKLNNLCYELRIPKYKSSELEYLEEYIILLEPIICALDFLQKKDNMYFGYFLPTLVTIKVKLQQLIVSKKLVHLQTICENILKSLLSRFKPYFEIHEEAYDAVVAAVTCPSIKTRFLAGLKETAPNFSHERLIALLVRYGKDFQLDVFEETYNQQQEPGPSHMFFDFGEDASNSETTNHSSRKEQSMQIELQIFLNDIGTSFESLEKFPTIKNLFYKYNTPLPSFPVEHMFTFSSLINSPRRQKLSDVNFERLVLFNKFQQNNV